MLTSLQEHKSLFLIIAIIASPFILLWSIVYGSIVGGIGGVVWGIQKGRNFILSKDSNEERSGLVLAFFQWILGLFHKNKADEVPYEDGTTEATTYSQDKSADAATLPDSSLGGGTNLDDVLNGKGGSNYNPDGSSNSDKILGIPKTAFC